MKKNTQVSYITSSKIVAVSITAIVLIALTFLCLRVVVVSVRGTGSAGDSLVGRESTGIGFGRTTAPNVTIEVALIVDRTTVAAARVGADVVVALVVLVGVSLRTLRLG